MPKRLKIYYWLILILAAASLIFNRWTNYHYRWWNLAVLVPAMLLLRMWVLNNLKTEEKEYINNANRIPPLVWTLLIMAVCMIVMVLLD